MASQKQVKDYLAYWFQLGKPVVMNGGQEAYCPSPVVMGNSFSSEFEKCWSRIQEFEGRDCYLQGTSVTIEQLLSPEWEIQPCARCEMPVYMPTVVLEHTLCPCNDLAGWPNLDVPTPRLPVNNRTHLNNLSKRLQSREKLQPSLDPSMIAADQVEQNEASPEVRRTGL